MAFDYNPAPPVEFGARGVDVPVAWTGGATVTVTGNSFAAPHITGFVARILGQHPGLAPFEVKTILRALAPTHVEASLSPARQTRIRVPVIMSPARSPPIASMPSREPEPAMHVTRIVSLLVALLLLTAACSQGAESTAPDEASSPTVQDDASADPTTGIASEPVSGASEPSEAVPAPQVTDCRPASGDEGAQQCTTTVFEPRLSMTLPEGWAPESQFGESPMSASFFKEVDADIPPYLGFNRVPKVYEYPADGGTPEVVDAPDDMVAFLSDLPGVEATEPEQTTVAGRDATQLDLTIADPPEAAPEGDCGGPPPPGIFVFNFNDECVAYFFPPDAEVRVLVVELDGEAEPLVIAMEYGAELRDEALADLDTILSSLQIGTSA